jgi:hypothetical protein
LTSEESSVEPTKAKGETMGEKTMEVADKVAEEMGIPTWGVIAIFVGTSFA